MEEFTMNEQNSNPDNNKSQNTSQPFDYKAHYRQQNHPHENTYYRKSENNHSQSYYQETNNSRYYQNNSNQPPTPPENPPYTQSYPSSDNTKQEHLLFPPACMPRAAARMTRLPPTR